MKFKFTTSLAFLAALTLSISNVSAKNIKVQASSKAGDWAHKFMTEQYAPRLKAMTGGSLSLTVLPTKAVVPHRENNRCCSKWYFRWRSKCYFLFCRT